MNELQPIITNLAGDVLGKPRDFWDCSVEIPLNDSRLAHVTISIYDPVCGPGGTFLTPADHMLKIMYGDYLVFWGAILTPVWNASENAVQIQAHDPTIRLKRHYHRYGDFAVGTRREGGYPINGMGAKLLVLSAFPTDRQEDLGWPHPGIYFGIDTTTNFAGTAGPMPSYPRPDNLNDAEDDDALWRVVERGTNVWESMTNVTEGVEGFDMEFVPVDSVHPPITNQTGSGNWVTLDWEPGFYVAMNTWESQGKDRTRDNDTNHQITVDGDTIPYGARNVIFQCGIGRDNLDNFVFRPDASAMRNYVGFHTPGGERNRGDKKKFAHGWVQESAEQYGQYHEWQSSGQKDNKRTLKSKVKAYLAGYGFPPSYFDIELSPERQSGAVQAEEPF